MQKIMCFVFADTVSLGLRPVLGNFSAQEIRAAAELVNPVDPILDTDPAIEPLAFQLAKDRVVVVEPFADFSVA